MAKVSLCVPLLVILCCTSALAADRGQGGCVASDPAPIYLLAKGKRLMARGHLGDCLVGITTGGTNGTKWEFEEENGRVHVAFFTNAEETGQHSDGWMNPADLSSFTYECGCGSTDQDRAECSPLAGAGKSFSWNTCYKEAREKKLAVLKQLVHGSAATPATEIPPGPSMMETEAWIKSELPPMGSDRVVTRYKESTWGDRFEIESAVLSKCLLEIRQGSQHEAHLDDGTVFAANRQTTTSRIPMKDIDVGKLLATEVPVGEDTTKSKPTYSISLIALSDRGDPFLQELDGYAGGKASKSVHVDRVRVSDQNKGNEAVEVLRRAAVLCGAPNRPTETVLAETAVPTKTPLSKPASPGTSRMGNTDVIELVAAGLSEEVIITSVRQAPARDFDLSTAGLIRLKKAHVSDAVISAMQNSGTTVQPTAATEATAPPKYDPSLANPPKPTAAPAPDNGCAGVEAMGFYKNEIFDRAMGGGVVEWLAKIRNNTGVTKIVVFGWRDMYGQQQRAQVQIRGGDIASPRVDMTQARAIPPVADLRLLSCD